VAINGKSRILDVAVSVIIAAICALAYRKITRLWWMWDDPYHLNLFPTTSFGQLFFSRHFWRAYPAQVYTPLQLVSLKADLLAFGLNADAFYLHQLAAVSLGAIALYFALRQSLDPIASSATALLAFLGPALARTVPQLMTRHYFEGLIFVLAAWIAFARKRPALSAILYFISTLAKEVFVPLPLLLLVVYPKRWRELFPHGAALIIYSVTRIVILGSVHGYGYTVPASRWPLAILTAPVRMVRALIGDAGIAGICLVVAVLLCVALIFIRDRHQRLVIGAAAFAAIVPILPVSIDMQSRYVLMTWLLASVAVGLLLKRFTLVVLIVALIANRGQWAHTMRETLRMSDEARAYASSSASDLLLNPLVPPATIIELRNLTHSTGRWLYDQQPLCAKRISADHILTYDVSSRRVREMTGDNLALECASIRSAPLSVTLSGAGDRLFWNFGPYRDGTYHIILNDGLHGFEVPRSVGFRLAGTSSLSLRVRYDSPAGWSTYSPDLTVDLAHFETVSWYR
jgi:hypothetical protein